MDWLSAEPQTAQSPANKRTRFINLCNNAHRGILSDLPGPKASAEALMKFYKPANQASKARAAKFENNSYDIFDEDSD